MHRKKPKGRRHTISISFIVTFVLLAGVYTAFYLSVVLPHIDVEHLPQNVPSYSSFWAKYVPADSVQFGFQNYSKIRHLNSSYPFQNKLLQLVKPSVAINTDDVDYFLTIVLAQPNITLDMTFLNQQSYLNFQAPLLALSGFGEQSRNATLFNVAVSNQGQVGLGWLALLPQDNAVAFAAGTVPAKQAIQLSLQSAANPSGLSILSRSDMLQSLYIVGGIRDHLGLGAQNFPGVVRSGLMTFISIDSSGPYVYVKNVVAFANSTSAMNHYADVKQGYLGAQKLVVYDSYVLAQEQDPLSKLGADYRIVL